MAIIPAHNEEDGIEKTIGSLLRQEPAPSVVLVMADNWVHVLSGAATTFPAGVLRHNERARGNELPGRRLPPQHRWCARRADRLRFLPRRHRAPHGADPAGRGNPFQQHLAFTALLLSYPAAVALHRWSQQRWRYGPVGAVLVLLFVTGVARSDALFTS